jgi:hypothetical protein
MRTKIVAFLAAIALIVVGFAPAANADGLGPAQPNTGCVNQALGGAVENIWLNGEQEYASRWVISNHACAGTQLGMIYESNLGGGYCQNGNPIYVRIQFLNGVLGGETATACGGTWIQIGSEKDVNGPMFRVLARIVGYPQVVGSAQYGYGTVRS